MLKSKTLSSTCVHEFLSKRIISIPDNLLESHWHSIINPAQLESIVVILEMVSIICSLGKTPTGLVTTAGTTMASNCWCECVAPLLLF